jgi:anti-anti-sigma factor
VADGKIESTCIDGVRHIRLSGDLRFRIGPRFAQFIRSIFTESVDREVVIDLNDVLHLDSTMLGLLARIARYALARGGGRPKILSSRDDVNVLLETMGFSSVFEIRNDPSPDVPGMEEIPGVSEDESLPETVLEAHRSLMRVNDRTAAQFREVVAYLEDEVPREDDVPGTGDDI